MDSVFLDCFLRKPGRFPPDGGGSPPDPGGGGGGDDDDGGPGTKRIPDVPPKPPEPPDPEKCSGWVCDEDLGTCKLVDFDLPPIWDECWPGNTTKFIVGPTTIYKNKPECEANCGDPPSGPTTPREKKCPGWICDEELGECESINFTPPAKWKECWPGNITQVTIGGIDIFKNKVDCEVNCDDPGPTTPRERSCAGWVCDEDSGTCKPKIFVPPISWKDCWPGGQTQVTIGGDVIYKNKVDCAANCGDKPPPRTPPEKRPPEPPKPPGPTTPKPLFCEGWICNKVLGNCVTIIFGPPAKWDECWPDGLTVVTIGGSTIYKNKVDCAANCGDKPPPRTPPEERPPDPPEDPGPTTPRERNCNGWVCNDALGNCVKIVFGIPSNWDECWPDGVTVVTIGGSTIYKNKVDCAANCGDKPPPRTPPEERPPDPPEDPGPTTPGVIRCSGWSCNEETNKCDPQVFVPPSSWKECWPGGQTQVTIGGNVIFKNKKDCSAECKEVDPPPPRTPPEERPPDPPEDPGPTTPGVIRCSGWVCDEILKSCKFKSFTAPANWDECWPGGETSVSVGGSTFFKNKFECELECGGEGEKLDQSLDTPPDVFDSATGGDQSATLSNYLEKTYRTDYIDPVFDRRLNFLELSQTTNDIKISRGDLDPILFKSRVHSSIKGVTEINKGTQKFSDIPYGDISNSTIKQSLDREFREQLISLRDLSGRSMSSKVFRTIRRLIISNDLSRFNPSIFKKLQLLQYTNRKTYVTKEGSNTAFNETSAVSIALLKSKPLDPEGGYGRVQQENIKLWKTIATDINKYIPITYSDRSSDKLFIEVDDGVNVFVSGVGDTKIFITDGDLLPTDQGFIPIKSDIDRAFMMDFEDTEQVLYLLDDNYSIQLDVTTPAKDLVEESYELSSSREDLYFFKLDASTIEDLPRTNELVRKTKAKYDIELTASGRNAWVGFKPWPYFVFYVMHDDPILDYIEAKERVTLTFKDFTLDNFVGKDLPIFPRRLPWHFIIIPTDKTELVLYHTYSKVVSYGDRRLTFTLNINPEEYKQRWDHHYLRTHYSYPRLDSRKKENTQAVVFAMELDKVTDLDRYIKGTEDLPRKERPYRKVLKLLREFRDEFILEDVTVAWFDIYSRMQPNDIKSFPSEVLSFKDFKSRALSRGLSDNKSVSRQYPKVKDIPNLGNTESTRSLGYISPKRKIDSGEEPDLIQPL